MPQLINFSIQPGIKRGSFGDPFNTERDKMNGNKRANVQKGKKVSIVLKKDQQTGNVTIGIVKDILTNSPDHPHGIKVRLESGDVGRVKEILN
jgi:uncharacterized repeat protein (TIGR03833 family)